MSSKQRMLTALNGGAPDRLPVTGHFVVPSYLDKHMAGISVEEFYDVCGWDPIAYPTYHRPDLNKNEYYDPSQKEVGFLESRRIFTDDWRIESEVLEGHKYPAKSFRFVTPGGSLNMTLEFDGYSAWVTEYPVKKKGDIELIGKYVTAPKCDVDKVNEFSDSYGERGLVRSYICCFDIFRQPGTWQDACCLYGVENMIMAAHDDPHWMHEFLTILFERKKTYIQSLAGAHYDILELGGGSASSTVISPRLFDDFVAPYDSTLIELAHQAGQKISYHTCGGMMPILERIVAMKPDAMETFTPPGMGGDADLAEARRRIPQKICMIGGFDQYHYFTGCTPEQTRAEVRRCFDAAGRNGAYILCPSDQFFEGDPELLKYLLMRLKSAFIRYDVIVRLSKGYPGTSHVITVKITNAKHENTEFTGAER
jgi:uroporphyrinogen decarboxylase